MDPNIVLQGKNGDNGASGVDGTSYPHSADPGTDATCKSWGGAATEPTIGDDGRTGGDAANGTAGTGGSSAGNLVITVSAIYDMSIQLAGGDGGGGGSGGMGGNGQSGGGGGRGIKCHGEDIDGKKGGDGGNGGNGGSGGSGGDGGDGGTLSVLYGNKLGNLSISQSQGCGGRGGAAGKGGIGGPGGVNCNSSGQMSKGGNPGANGANGAYGRQGSKGTSIIMPAPPLVKLNKIDPESCPMAGGVPFKILGDNLPEGLKIEFGGNTATAITLVGSNEVDGVVPTAQSAGNVIVVATDATGFKAVLPVEFKYT